MFITNIGLKSSIYIQTFIANAFETYLRAEMGTILILKSKSWFDFDFKSSYI